MTTGNPSEHFPDGPALENDPVFIQVRNTMLYRDIDTASRTFALGEAVKLVLDTTDGEDLDRERLGRLLDIIDPEPPLYPEQTEDGTTIWYDDEGAEVRRDPPSLEFVARLQAEKEREQAVADYVSQKAPAYLAQVAIQLADPSVVTATVTSLVERSQRNGELYTPNEAELATLNAVRDQLREAGQTVTEAHTRVGADGTVNHPKIALTHTLHTLTVSR